MEQSASQKSETDLKKSFANGNARNVLQSAGNNTAIGKFFIESFRSREIMLNCLFQLSCACLLIAYGGFIHTSGC